MAEHANSTPMPEVQAPLIHPLPPKASQAWQDFWTQMTFLAPPEKASAAVLSAYAGGANLDDLCAIQLACPKDRIQAMPRLWFGPDQWSACRVFSPIGEVEQ